MPALFNDIIDEILSLNDECPLMSVTMILRRSLMVADFVNKIPLIWFSF